MITAEEFDAALDLISAYRIQLEQGLLERSVFQKRAVDLQEGISNTAFVALRDYYEKNYATVLVWEDLKTMDENLLAAIDFSKMTDTRGFGIKSKNNFKKLLISTAVLVEEV